MLAASDSWIGFFSEFFCVCTKFIKKIYQIDNRIRNAKIIPLNLLYKQANRLSISH
jgi:hypothetical protein